MNNLLNVTHLFLEEKKLAEQAMSSVCYSARNMLIFIENRQSFHPDFFLSQLDFGIIGFYEKIKPNTRLKFYTEQIRKKMQLQISDEILDSLKILLKKILEEESFSEDPNYPIVKKLF